MNLNISYNWLKQYVGTKKTPQEFARLISLSGPSVDSIEDVKPNFKKVVVGQILSLDQHPDADKLRVCQVSVGKQKLQIVCGASNIKKDQKVPVVLVGGMVGDFEIKAAKLRGVESHGMMCSQKELGLGDDHAGIYILPDYLEVGLPLEKVMPIDDAILDMEVTSNRPDSMSLVGIAREASAIMEEKFLYEESKPRLKVDKEIKLSVSVKENKLCPRYQAIVMDNIKVGPSPLWMQSRLLSAGLRPINNLVDITNYILLELGRPMHVFDYEKLNGHEINVRLAKKGEKIKALDGKAYELTSDQLVIADSKDPVAVAGIMGGELSAATNETKTIVLEAANFDPVNVRRTARALNLYSDSSSLFEKGLSPIGTNAALMRAIELVMELAGGKPASKILDVDHTKTDKKQIKLSLSQVNKILGIELEDKKVKSILQGLGFEVKEEKKYLVVQTPWWRHGDVEEEHDLIEEIARIYGYHNLPSVLPSGIIPTGQNQNKEFALESRIKNILVGAGLAENYNYSFISEKLIKDCGLDPIDHIKIANPLNADFEYMRISLVPGMLQSVAENESNFNEIKIFELSKVYGKQEGDLANEKTKLCMAVSSADTNDAFFELKGVVQLLLQKLYIDEAQMEMGQREKYFAPNQSMIIKTKDAVLGHFGIVDREVLYLSGLKRPVAIVELDFEAIIHVAQTTPAFKSLAKFPVIELDLSVEIAKSVNYQDIVNTIKDMDALIENIIFLSEYRGDKVASDKKALAFRIVYRDQDKTLKSEEAQKVHNAVVKKLEKEYNIKVR